VQGLCGAFADSLRGVYALSDAGLGDLVVSGAGRRCVAFKAVAVYWRPPNSEWLLMETAN
jgi:hypothetical protein